MEPTENRPEESMLVHVIRDVKGAIRDVEAKAAARTEDGVLAVRVAQVDLTLKTVLKRKGGAGFKLWLVDASGSYASEDVRTLTMSLKPEDDGVELMGGTVRDELVRAIEEVVSAVREAGRVPPAFGLEKATVELHFTVTKEGKVSVVAEGSGSRADAHTVKLTLAGA